MVSSYEYDYKTADAESLPSKAKYRLPRAGNSGGMRRCSAIISAVIQAGGDHPEEVNRVGYETAMRWTKGKYTFFVATHTDRQHIYNHIYYNSTSLDCSHKFRDFIGSARALRRLSDRVCLGNDLSVIINSKLYSKGRFLHYGVWVEAERQPSYKERLQAAICDALTQNPDSFDTFLQLKESATS